MRGKRNGGSAPHAGIMIQIVPIAPTSMRPWIFCSLVRKFWIVAGEPAVPEPTLNRISFQAVFPAVSPAGGCTITWPCAVARQAPHTSV